MRGRTMGLSSALIQWRHLGYDIQADLDHSAHSPPKMIDRYSNQRIQPKERLHAQEFGILAAQSLSVEALKQGDSKPMYAWGAHAIESHHVRARRWSQQLYDSRLAAKHGDPKGGLGGATHSTRGHAALPRHERIHHAIAGRPCQRQGPEHPVSDQRGRHGCQSPVGGRADAAHDGGDKGLCGGDESNGGQGRRCGSNDDRGSSGCDGFERRGEGEAGGGGCVLARGCIAAWDRPNRFTCW